MIDWIIDRSIDALEKRLGVSVDYLREVAGTSRAAFLKIVMFMPMAQHRGGLGAAAGHVAGLTATLYQDCGTCAQIAINEAVRDDVPVAWIKAVLAGRPDDLPHELGDVYHFARAVVEQGEDVPEWRQRVRGHVGEDGLVGLSLVIAAAQVFPVIKRGLGHDVSCRLMEFSFHGAREGRTNREQVPLAKTHV